MGYHTDVCKGIKWAGFVAFPVLCLLPDGDTALRPEFLLALGHTKRGVTMTLFVLFFPASGYLETPNTVKQGNEK